MNLTTTVTIAGSSSTVTIVSVPDVQREFKYTFGERDFLDPYAAEDTETVAIAATRFAALWNVWSLRRAAAYGRMYEAIASEALTDPTENYDRKEDGGWKDTNEIGKRVRDTENTPAVVNTSEQFIAGDDSAIPVLASKNVVTPGGQKDTGKITDDKATDTNTRLFQDYRVHGNIGVSTAADMAEKIIELQRHGLVMQALHEFIDLYTVYKP